MKKNLAILILLGAASAFAQSDAPRAASATSEPGGGTVTRVITLKYPNRVETNVLDGIGLILKRSNNLVVVTGTVGRVDTAEAILKQLDVPPPPPPPVAPRKDIQVTAYLIIASPNGSQGAPLPKDLESAIGQVSSVFPYKAFNLFDAIVMRLPASESGSLRGVLPQGQQTFPSGGTFNLRLGNVWLTEAAPANLLRFNSFSLDVSIVNGADQQGKEKTQSVSLQTSIDMKEGQKIVVGKANIDGSSNALIVILTAKVVD